MTEFSNFLRVSSTEGASALQVPQPGAQNHITTGFWASAFDKTNDSPLTVFAAKSLMFELFSDSTPSEDVAVVTTTELVEEESAPHAASASAATANAVAALHFTESA